MNKKHMKVYEILKDLKTHTSLKIAGKLNIS